MTGRSFVLCVGVDHYDDPRIPDLRWAATDARAVHRAMTRGRRQGEVESALLLDGEATLKAVRRALSTWLRTATPADSVLVYMALHGARELPDPGRSTEVDAYLVPADAELDDLYASTLSLRHELPALVRSTPAQHVVVLLDCCVSGAAGSPLPGTRSRGIDGPGLVRARLVAGLSPSSAVTTLDDREVELGEGTVVLAACGPNQAAMEIEALGHGVFTHHLLESLAAHRSGDVAVATLYASTAAAVRATTRGLQTPVLEGRLSDQRLFVGG